MVLSFRRLASFILYLDTTTARVNDATSRLVHVRLNGKARFSHPLCQHLSIFDPRDYGQWIVVLDVLEKVRFGRQMAEAASRLGKGIRISGPALWSYTTTTIPPHPSWAEQGVPVRDANSPFDGT